MTSDFDEFLDQATEQLAEDGRVRAAAERDEEEQKQLFLRTFRDAVQNRILPVFKRVEARQSDSFGVTVAASQDEARLQLAMPANQAKRRNLSLRADHRAKRVYASINWETGSSSSDTETLTVAEITRERVEKLVRQLMEGGLGHGR